MERGGDGGTDRGGKGEPSRKEASTANFKKKCEGGNFKACQRTEKPLRTSSTALGGEKAGNDNLEAE